jgi:hypothetical protein
MRKPDPNRDKGNDTVFIVMFAVIFILTILATAYIGGR